MNKTIEKIENYKADKLAAALEKAEKKLSEAKGSYRDTGYDRYYNKMQKYENEIEELIAYRDRDDAILDAISEKRRTRQELEEIKKDLSNKIFYLLKAIPDCSEARSLQTFVDRL